MNGEKMHDHESKKDNNPLLNEYFHLLTQKRKLAKEIELKHEEIRTLLRELKELDRGLDNGINEILRSKYNESGK